MTDSSRTAASETGEQLLLTRHLAAPRELVWKAWTEPERLAQWWGPKGVTIDSCTVDLRPGGIFHYCMRSPDGGEMWGKFVYQEIVAPERLVFVNAFSDAQGGTVRAPFSADWPLEILNTLTLTEHAGTTTLRLEGGPINATGAERRLFRDMQSSMREGFAGTFEQLDTYLANMTQR